MNPLAERMAALGFSARSLTRLAGGDINESFRAETDLGPLFVKTHRSPPSALPEGPGFFEAEARGLVLLAGAGLPTPRTLAIDERCLILEWLEPASSTPASERQAGRALASLHQRVGPRFGLDHDNFMGAIPQTNQPVTPDTFPCFFRQRRLLPLVERTRLRPETARRIERLPLGELLSDTTPRLIHGDLWRGNLLDTSAGPRFIDPATAYGHPEQDLAMTRLFGGFSSAFYDGYREIDPKPFDGGLAERLDVLNLYPLLIHVALFGGGYLRQVESLLDRFD